MAVWAIGDIQGCYDELSRMIDKLNYDPAQDALWFCGDLVNRGGQSLEVLRLVKSLNEQTVVTLGNHDLSLLAVGARSEKDQARVNPELRAVLFAPDRDDLLDWLRHRPLLHADRALGTMMIHAGLAPNWSIPRAESVAREIESQLRANDYKRLLRQMFGNKPETWSARLRGIERLRAGINVLTRMRFCDVRGRIAFSEKGMPGTQRPGIYPWFSVPGHIPRELRVVFGHWSTLGRFAGLGVHAIDTGCVWGGALTAMRIDVEEPEYTVLKSDRPVPQGKSD